MIFYNEMATIHMGYGRYEITSKHRIEKGVDYSIIVNKPLKGFRVTGFYSVAYKSLMARLLDPRNMEIGIDLNNFLDILKYGNVKNGEIMTPCIYGWDSGVYLVCTTHPEYQNHLKKKRLYGESFVESRLEVGRVYDIPIWGNNLLYLGRHDTYLPGLEYDIDGKRELSLSLPESIRSRAGTCGYDKLEECVQGLSKEFNIQWKDLNVGKYHWFATEIQYLYSGGNRQEAHSGGKYQFILYKNVPRNSITRSLGKLTFSCNDVTEFIEEHKTCSNIRKQGSYISFAGKRPSYSPWWCSYIPGYTY